MKFLFFFICGLLFLNCSVVPEQKQSIKDAISALQKIDSATKVNTTYQNYNALLIEARSKIDTALSEIDNQDLKSELESSIQAYTDAGKVWQEIELHPTSPDSWDVWMIDREKLTAKLLLEKYKIPEISKNNSLAAFKKSIILPTIWQTAKTHLDKAVEITK